MDKDKKEAIMASFYNMFGEEITDTQNLFLDNFSEFISNINDSALSDKALESLNDLFKKNAENFMESIENLKDSIDDLTTVHIKATCDEKSRWRIKIRTKIDRLTKLYDKYQYQRADDRVVMMAKTLYQIEVLKELLGDE